MRRLAFALPLLVACATERAVVTTPATKAAERVAEEPPPDPLAAQKRALHFAGLDTRVTALSALPRIVSGSIRQAALRTESGDLPTSVGETLSRMEAAASRTHDVEVLGHQAAVALAARDPGGRSKAASSYLEGEAHQKVQAELNRVLTPPGQKALGAFLARLPVTPPDPERLARARGIVQASGEVDLMVALTYGASRAMLDAVLGSFPQDARAALARHLAPRANEEATFRSKVERSLVMQTYFATRYVEDRHVIREAAFWRSEVGRWLATSRVTVVETLVLDRNRALVDALAGKTE